MKKGIGIAFILLCSVSCSNEIDSKTESKNSSEAEVTVQDQVIPVPDNQQTSKDTVEETPKLNTASSALSKSDEPTPDASDSNDPFSDVFDGGSGGGGGGGSSGTGDGAVTPSVPKITRTQLTKLDRSPFKIKQSAIIRLLLTIDADGIVLSASEEDDSHTIDQDLLNEIMDAVKKQVKYNRVPGAHLMKVKYEVFIEGTEMPIYVN